MLISAAHPVAAFGVLDAGVGFGGEHAEGARFEAGQRGRPKPVRLPAARPVPVCGSRYALPIGAADPVASTSTERHGEARVSLHLAASRYHANRI
jgi:hypothetical protein